MREIAFISNLLFTFWLLCGPSVVVHALPPSPLTWQAT